MSVSDTSAADTSTMGVGESRPWFDFPDEFADLWERTTIKLQGNIVERMNVKNLVKRLWERGAKVYKPDGSWAVQWLSPDAPVDEPGVYMLKSTAISLGFAGTVDRWNYMRQAALVYRDHLYLAPFVRSHKDEDIFNFLIRIEAMADDEYAIEEAIVRDSLRVHTALLKWRKARNKRRAHIVLSLRRKMRNRIVGPAEKRVLKFLDDQ